MLRFSFSYNICCKMSRKERVLFDVKRNQNIRCINVCETKCVVKFHERHRTSSITICPAINNSVRIRTDK